MFLHLKQGQKSKCTNIPEKNMFRIYLVILQHCCARMQGCVSSAGNKLFGKQFVANCQCTVKVAQEKCKECDETVSYMVLLHKALWQFPERRNHCTMQLSFSKNGNRRFKSDFHHGSHFLPVWLFPTNYLEIGLCPVSLLIYIWGLVEHSQLPKKDLQ